MVFCVGFIALTILITAVITAIMCGTEHSTVVLCACFAVFCVRVSQCSTFVYHGMPVSQYHTHCPIVLYIGLFAMEFYLPALLIYCNILHVCTAASCMDVLHIHPARKKVVTQTDTSFVALIEYRYKITYFYVYTMIFFVDNSCGNMKISQHA